MKFLSMGIHSPTSKSHTNQAFLSSNADTVKSRISSSYSSDWLSGPALQFLKWPFRIPRDVDLASSPHLGILLCASLSLCAMISRIALHIIHCSSHSSTESTITTLQANKVQFSGSCRGPIKSSKSFDLWKLRTIERTLFANRQPRSLLRRTCDFQLCARAGGILSAGIQTRLVRH